MRSRGYFKAGEIYHVFNKSIANFRIFQKEPVAHRFLQILDYYAIAPKLSLSKFIEKEGEFDPNLLIPKDGSVVKFLAYCIMPDHYHLLIKVLQEKTVCKYMNDIENSFTRYFNLKHERKGPLWQSPFKSTRIKTYEQLLHVSRYIHLNPTTNNLVENPEDWLFSSYRNYIEDPMYLETILHEISIKNPERYRKFVEDQKDYQRTLKRIKKLLLE